MSSKSANGVLDRRRSERIRAGEKQLMKKSEPPKTTRNRQNPKTRQSGNSKAAPRYEDHSSSSSSDDDDEEEYDFKKDTNKMEIDEYSDELGEDFSDTHSEVSGRMSTRSLSSCSEKENTRQRSRSCTRKLEKETPSKMLAKQLSRTSIKTPSKNLSKERSFSNTPAKINERSPRKTAQQIDRKNKKVFREDSDSDFQEKIFEPRNTRTPNIIRIPANLIPKKISPIHITKTPGGTFKTRRRFRRNSDDEDENLGDPLDSKPASSLKELASRLHLSKVPEKLPCREIESREIEKFIREVIDPKKGESSAMYISGVPGTGKTATVRAVVSSMKKNKKCPKFVYVEVNAMMFKKTVFVEVYNGIQEEHNISKKNHRTKISSSTARQELNTMFKKEDKNRPPIVVLIDELDSLCNRKQDILYDIFEWTALPQSRVTIMGIANTLDFPERMLCQRNASRLDKRRLVFQPYQHEQIEEIVRARLQGSSLIEPKAIELVAKKIAMNTGDLRQALDFLCRAIGVADEKNAKKLEVGHVIAAQNAVLEPLKYRLVKNLTFHEFTLFRTIVNMTQDQEEVIFAGVYKQYCSYCTELSGVTPASDNLAFGLLLELSSIALVHIGKVNHGRANQRIKLGMTSMEAGKAIDAFVEAYKTEYSI